MLKEMSGPLKTSLTKPNTANSYYKSSSKKEKSTSKKIIK